MALKVFDTAIEETSEALVGPWRRPHQMPNTQVYDSHASIHDDATAQKLGFQGGDRGTDAFQPPARKPLAADVGVRSEGAVFADSDHASQPRYAERLLRALRAGVSPTLFLRAGSGRLLHRQHAVAGVLKYPRRCSRTGRRPAAKNPFVADYCTLRPRGVPACSILRHC